MIFGKPWNEVTVDDLDQLVQLRFSEGTTLDFKSFLPEKNQEEAWVRFLKVVAAFANTKGGTLLIGVHENGGIASKIEGIEIENWERFRQNLNQKISNSLDKQLIGIEFSLIPLISKKSVVAIEIPFSMRSPHRVRVREGEHVFVKRVEADTVEMSTEEIQYAFLRRDFWTKQAQDFRMERIEKVLSGNAGPLSLSIPSIFVHLLPLGPRDLNLNFKDRSVRQDLSEIIRLYEKTLNKGVLFQNEQLCMEGVFFRGELIPPHAQHLLLTPIGQVEFGAYCGHSEDIPGMSLAFWGSVTFGLLSHVLFFLLQQEIYPPYALFSSVVGVKNRKLLHMPALPRMASKELPRDRYDLPGVEIDTLSRDLDKTQIAQYLKKQYQPFFDLIWNDLNIPHSPNSDHK
jgi:hypothetical protein